MSEADWVLDASALLAAMLGEVGAEVAQARLAQACISAVSLSEVIAKLAERGIPADVILESLGELDLDVRAFDSAQAERAGLLRLATREQGLSLGDRACLALAQQLSLPAVTTDRAWSTLDIGVPIELAR